MEISALYEYFLECQGVTTDSRNCPAGSLFIALKGASFDGNRFASQALEQGCRYAVVDEPEYAGTDSRILLVDDCLETLQQLAGYHRRKLGTRIIGITGTNGKLRPRSWSLLSCNRNTTCFIRREISIIISGCPLPYCV